MSEHPDVIEGELVPEDVDSFAISQVEPEEILDEEPVRISKREFLSNQLLMAGVPPMKVERALEMVCAGDSTAGTDVRTVEEWDEAGVQIPEEIDLSGLLDEEEPALAHIPEPTPTPNPDPEPRPVRDPNVPPVDDWDE